MSTKKQWLIRILIGGALGIGAHLLLGYLLGCFSLFGPAHFRGFRFPSCGFPRELEWLGVLLSFALWAIFGGELAAATLPFADSGRELVMHSLIHFLITSATVGTWAWLNFGLVEILFFLIPLVLLYLLIWLARWVGWYAEVAAIREKLGLAPGPSALKWRETLPYVGFAFLLCLILPTVLRLCGGPVPVLSVLYSWLLLPAGGFFSGLSLGRRHGICPLYPVACGVCILLFIPIARLFSNMADGFLIPLAFCAALAGNITGAGYAWAKKKRKEHH